MWSFPLVLAALLAPGAPASFIQSVKFPTKRLILRPKSSTSHAEGAVVPTELTIGEPLDSNLPNMCPSFTMKLDSTIACASDCLEASGFEDGDAVRVNRCTGGSAQKWNWIPCGHGRNMIQLQETNMCIDVVDDEIHLKEAPVRLRACERTATEAWRLVESEPASFSHGFTLTFGVRHLMIGLAALAGLGVVNWKRWLRSSQLQTCTAISRSAPFGVHLGSTRRQCTFQSRGLATMSDADRPEAEADESGPATINASPAGYERTEPGWADIASGCALFLVLHSITLTGASSIVGSSDAVFGPIRVVSTTAFILIQQLAGLPASTWLPRGGDGKDGDELLQNPLAPVVACALFALVAWGPAIGLQATGNTVEAQALLPAARPLPGLATAFEALLAAPITEEIFFRGWLLSSLARMGVADSVAIGASAVTFSLWHATNAEGGLLFYALLGAWLAVLYQRSGNRLWVPIGTHFLWNLCVALLRAYESTF